MDIIMNEYEEHVATIYEGTGAGSRKLQAPSVGSIVRYTDKNGNKRSSRVTGTHINFDTNIATVDTEPEFTLATY